MTDSYRQNFLFAKCLSILLAVCFAVTAVLPGPVYAQALAGLPDPGVMVETSLPARPVLLKGIQVHPENPLLFDFIISTGDMVQGDEVISTEIERLIKYFLAALTIPENKLWVNLSPYEDDRIMDDALAGTLFGEELLAQDYLLKQLASSMLHPDKDLGRAFWARVYAKVAEKFGAAEVPVDTFNKVWVVADTATILEKNGVAFIKSAHLRVMMEEDYQALEQSAGNTQRAASEEADGTHTLSSQIMREIIIPEIEKEVNTGINFAPLRQVFHSFILASWYKKTLKESLLTKTYADHSMTGGVESDMPNAREQVYQRYLEAYHKGVFDLIREDTSGETVVPHRYFSGGAVVSSARFQYVDFAMSDNDDLSGENGDLQKATVSVIPVVIPVGFVSDEQVTPDNTNDVTEDTEFGRIDLEGVARTELIAALKNEGRQEAATQILEDIDEARERIADETKKNGHSKETQKRILSTGISMLLVEDVSKRMPYGFALDRNTNRIYISREFLNRVIADRTRMQYFFARQTYELIVGGTEGRALAYAYARSKSPDVINALFSPGPLPHDLVYEFESGLPLMNGSSDEYARLAEEVGSENFIGPSENQIDAVGIVAKEFRRAAYQYASNVLNGIDNPLDDTEAVTLATFVEKVRSGKIDSIALYGTKLAPPTIMHEALLLKVKAMFGPKVVLFNISKMDPRKPSVLYSFLSRFKLGQITARLMKGLVKVLDIQKDDDLDWRNAEEVLLELLEAIGHNSQIGLKLAYYVAGSDHRFIFAPEKGNRTLLNFFKPNPNERRYFTTYIQAAPMVFKRLVRRQYDLSHVKGTGRRFYLDNDEDIDTEAQALYEREKKAKKDQARAFEKIKEDLKAEHALRKKIIHFIVDESTTEKDLLTAMNEWPIFPMLDVPGKLFIIQKAHEKQGGKTKIVFAHTVRTKDIIDFGSDPLGDEMVRNKEILMANIPGVDIEVSATLAREGIVDYLKDKVKRVVNFARFYVNRWTFVPDFFANQAKIAEDILRGADTVVAHNLMSDPERDRRMLAELRATLPANMRVGGLVIGDKDTLLNVSLPGKKEFLVRYSVAYGFYGESSPGLVGEWKNTVQLSLTEAEIKQNPELAKVVDFIRQVEGVIIEGGLRPAEVSYRKDAAQAADPAQQDVTASYGGIDLGSELFNFDIEGDGAPIRFNVDPAIIQKLGDEGFRGLQPHIIQVVPAPSLPVIFGQNKPMGELELQLAGAGV